MSNLSFIASLISSLVWPVVVVVVLVIFRKEILKLLERPLSRLKVGPVEADWEKTENVVKQNLVGRSDWDLKDSARLSASPAPGAEPEGLDRESSPRQVVESRWRVIEEELRTMISGAGTVPSERLDGANFDQLVDTAVSAGLINAATLRSLDGLRHMRNLALSASDLNESQAQEFAVLAGAVLYAMKNPPGRPSG